MTQRYAHLSPAHKLNAVERLGRRRTGITTGTSEETAEKRREPPTQVRDQQKEKERATGVEPATSSLGSCSKTTPRTTIHLRNPRQLMHLVRDTSSMAFAGFRSIATPNRHQNRHW